jgi:ABC-type multidrug transport system fused ATPase/permease subunit
METAALFRLVRLLEFSWTKPVWAHVFAVLVGLTHVGWIVLVILFVGLMLTEGQVRVQDAEVAQVVSRLLDREVTAGRSVVRNAGMLPLVVDSQHHWFGPMLKWIYQKVSWTRGDASYLMGLLCLAMTLGILRLLLAYGHSRIMAKFVTQFGMEVRRRLFVRKLALGREALDRSTDERLGRLIRDDAQQVEAGVSAWLSLLPREPIRTLALVLSAVLINFWLGLIFVLLGMLVAMLGWAWVRSASERGQSLIRAARAAVDRLGGLATKTRLIKGYAADEYIKQHYERALTAQQAAELAYREHDARIGPIGQLLALVVLLTLLGVAGQNILSDRFGVAGAVGVLTALFGIGWSGVEVVMKRPAIRSADAAAERILDFLESTSPSPQMEGSAFLPAPKQAIEWTHVSFHDSNHRLLLSDVSLTIPANSRLVLLATDPLEARAFVDVLCRFIDPEMGTVRFDGRSLRDFTLESVRAQVCLLLGDELLFPDTVANNIGCGDPSFSREKIVEAAKVAHAHHFVERLPKGYGCVIGEGGYPLKPGEAFRIGLARLVLRDPSVAIIEEPDGALDMDTRSLLNDTLRRFLKRRTSILLPQSLQTLVLGERVVVLDKGRVVAAGTHQQLFDTNPVYRFLLLARFSEEMKSDGNIEQAVS